MVELGLKSSQLIFTVKLLGLVWQMGCFAKGVKSFIFKEKSHMHKLANGTNFNLRDECINLSTDQKIGNRKEFRSKRTSGA